MALYRHVLNGTFPGEVWSFGLHTNGAPSLSAAQTAWVDAVTAFWSTAFAGIVAADVAAVQATTAELDQATGKQISKVENGVTLVGASTAEPLPFQCAPVVSFRTNLATRAGRGRIYAPSLAVDQVAGGRLNATAQGVLADSAAAMLTTLSGAALSPVLYSRTTKGIQAIVRLDVGDVIDTQRRRRNKLIEARVSRNV